MELWIGITLVALTMVILFGVVPMVTLMRSSHDSFGDLLRSRDLENAHGDQAPRGFWGYLRRIVGVAVLAALAFGVFSLTSKVFFCSSHKEGGVVKSSHGNGNVFFEDKRRWAHVPGNVLKSLSPGSRLERSGAVFGYQVNDEKLNGMWGILDATSFAFGYGLLLGGFLGIISPLFDKGKRTEESEQKPDPAG